MTSRNERFSQISCSLIFLWDWPRLVSVIILFAFVIIKNRKAFGIWKRTRPKPSDEAFVTFVLLSSHVFSFVFCFIPFFLVSCKDLLVLECKWQDTAGLIKIKSSMKRERKRDPDHVGERMMWTVVCLKPTTITFLSSSTSFSFLSL